MSPLVRGYSIIFCTLILTCIFFYNRAAGKSDDRRSMVYLKSLALLFPLIDVGFSLGKLFELVTLSFVLINYDIFKGLFSKKFVLFWILIAIFLISALFSEFKVESLLSIPQRVSFIVPLFLSYIIVRKRGYEPICRLFIFPIIWTISFGAIQIFIKPDFSLYYSAWFREFRLSSCMRDPQIAGCVMAVFITFLWSYYITMRKKAIIVLLCIVSLGIIGAYTGSKSFILGCGLGVIGTTVYGNLRIKQVLSFVALGLALIFTQDYWMQLPFFERLNDMDSSLEGRQDVFWLSAIAIFMDHWIAGIGVGTFQNYVESHNLPLMHSDGEGGFIYAQQPESGYLLWLDELGIMSLIYIVILIDLIRRKGNRILNPSLIFPWLVAFVSLFNLSSAHLIFVLSLIMGTIYSLSNKPENENSSNDILPLSGRG